jgi:hypothetical protein
MVCGELPRGQGALNDFRKGKETIMVESTRIIYYTEKHGNVNVRLLLPTKTAALRDIASLLKGKVMARDLTNANGWDFPSALSWQIPLSCARWSYISMLMAKDIATITAHANRRDVQSMKTFAWFIGHSLRQIAGRQSAAIGPNIVIDDQVSMPIAAHMSDIRTILKIEAVMDSMINGAYATTPMLYRSVHHNVADTWFGCLKALRRARELESGFNPDCLDKLLPAGNNQRSDSPQAQKRQALVAIKSRILSTEPSLHSIDYNDWLNETILLVTAATEAQLDITY